MLNKLDLLNSKTCYLIRFKVFRETKTSKVVDTISLEVKAWKCLLKEANGKNA